LGHRDLLFLWPNLLLISIPHKLPILEHAVASAAPAASYKSLLRSPTTGQNVLMPDDNSQSA
jgi:hypothetical protein